MSSIKSIAIIGSGNVAWHLSHCFVNKNLIVNCIISRSLDSARILAESVNSDYSNNIKDISTKTDLILICTTDNSISELSDALMHSKAIIAHTAGSVPLSALCNKQRGVFYPFQTFTKNVFMGKVDFPVCIEANEANVLTRLNELASLVSEKVVIMNSTDRVKLHLAGIFANNFTNFLYTQAYNLLKINDISTDLLLPIIRQTSLKLERDNPEKLQTGPAVRGMIEIIKEHELLLKDNEELKNLYTMLSGNILDYYKLK